MYNFAKNEQSFRKSGNSAFYSRIKGIKHPILKLFFTLLAILIVILLYKNKIDCIFKSLLNIHCFGCGMTRAYIALLHGNIVQAFRWHFMFPSVPIVYLYILFDGKLFCNKKLNLTVLVSIIFGFFIHWLMLFI